MSFPSGSVGLNADHQLFTQGQRGGMQNWPHSGVLTGLLVTAGTVTATSIPLSVTAGSARLDGILVTASGTLTPTAISGTGFNTPQEQVFDVYLNPTRVIPAGAALPSSPSSPADRFILVASGLKTDTVAGYYKSNPAGNAWVQYNPIYDPSTYSHNNMIFTEVKPAPIVNGSISIQPEKDIYTGTGIPSYVAGVSQAWIRRSASIHLARITVASSVADVATPIYSKASI